MVPIIQKQPKALIIYSETNDAVKFTSRDILFQLKSFIQENFPVAEITIFTPTLKSDYDKTALTVRPSSKFKN